MALIDLMQTCAPYVATSTMAAIIKHESGGNPHALHNNTLGKSIQPASKEEAVVLATQMIKAGQSVDMGLGQVNSQHLAKYQLTVEQVLDPCTNLKIAQDILLSGWKSSGGSLMGTLSAYNTGQVNSIKGLKYAREVFAQAGNLNFVARPGIAYAAQTPMVSSLTPKGFSLFTRAKDE
ncbi:lytic transglycosylase domain-containing protein [Polynucleobacter sp. Fuers-14]|uniref:lytic transglycosylase domain-containing protein n=1 Tax=Polynucleobacter sp. Fuers-14 TaxID=1758364 RepID=UPI001C0D518F|nr:lytic transglycosylase domain-containing protein [Polynucleobacter sp. Fuers-14]MBU3640972.1 lytic transglycosylase domain-containing protein [Polynucleobacter sp. Fuers-14]